MKNKEIQSSNFIKIAVSVVAAVLLVALYALIFSFSEQNGEESSNLSYKVSEKCVEVVEAVSRKNWTRSFKQELAAYFEHPIRKLAHFCEYACMGLLVWLLLTQWLPVSKKVYLLAVAWVFVSASLDELHQLFVPDRCGSFADVLLDTFGGGCGMWACGLMLRVLQRMRFPAVRSKKRRKRSRKHQSCTE